MATTKGTTARGGGAKAGATRAKATTAKSRTAKTTAARSSSSAGESPKTASRSTASRPADVSLAARTGRTIKERPYTSAAIATGAVVGVAAAAAAGAFFASRRDRSFKEASDELTSKVRDGFASASDKVKDLSQRGVDYIKGDSSERSSDTRSQREIAEEALSLKTTGETSNPAEELSSVETKAGAISY